MFIAVKLQRLHLSARAFGDFVQHGGSRRLLFKLALYLHVEKALGLKVRSQILSAFVDQVRVHRVLLVHRDEFSLCALPYVRALKLDLNSWALSNVKGNVSTVRLGVIERRNELHAC